MFIASVPKQRLALLRSAMSQRELNIESDRLIRLAHLKPTSHCKRSAEFGTGRALET